MIDSQIETYLQQKNITFDSTVIQSIESKRVSAIEEQNEHKANYFWCLRQIYKIQKNFVLAFDNLTNEKYEDAWNLFDIVDIELGYLEQNYNTQDEYDRFHLLFIGKMIKEYQKLFPYHYFLSREAIVKEEKCNICGRIASIRNPCEHIPGKIYMGKLCLREITDLEFKAFAIVTDPFDKYTILKMDNKEYNYGMLKYLLEIIHSPYDEFHVKTEKIKKEEFKGLRRNEQCPCGSGKKYKRCHLGKEDEMINHYIICVDENCLQLANRVKPNEIKIFNTWEN